MDKNTFSTESVINKLSEFVCIYMDGDQNRELVKKYRVSGYPSFVFLYEKGEVIQQLSGYKDAAQFNEIFFDVQKEWLFEKKRRNR